MNIEKMLGPLTRDDMTVLLPELLALMPEIDVLTAMREYLLKNDLVGELDADTFTDEPADG
jgi:hypothetical protein